MFDQQFRQKIMHPLGQPLAKFLSKLGVTANQVTVVSFLISILSAYYFSQGDLRTGILAWWLSRLLDGLDGVLARYTNSASLFGGFLDITLDMLAYSAVIIGFSFSFPSLNHLWLLVLTGYIGCITTALSLAQINTQVVQQKDNRSLSLAMGLAEATETGIAYSLFAVFPDYLGTLVIIWISVLAITILSRIIYAYNIFKRQ